MHVHLLSHKKKRSYNIIYKQSTCQKVRSLDKVRKDQEKAKIGWIHEVFTHALYMCDMRPENLKVRWRGKLENDKISRVSTVTSPVHNDIKKDIKFLSVSSCFLLCLLLWVSFLCWQGLVWWELHRRLFYMIYWFYFCQSLLHVDTTSIFFAFHMLSFVKRY